MCPTQVLGLGRDRKRCPKYNKPFWFEAFWYNAAGSDDLIHGWWKEAPAKEEATTNMVFKLSFLRPKLKT